VSPPSPPSAAVVIPTAGRPDYLDVALASIVPQARGANVEVLVVDDGPSDATKETAARHGARYVATTPPGGLNAARNLGLDATDADLVIYVDDDVRAQDGWLDAILAAAAAHPDEVGVLTGPIRASFEGHRFRTCGREGAPITTTDLGTEESDAPHAWGANMAIRRTAVARVGRFDEGGHLTNAGDEQEWQDRWRAAGGRIRYVPGAALEHRRAGDDARVRSLCRSAYHRGRASRRFDVFKRTHPSLKGELRTLVGCVLHGPRHACMNGPVLTAHTAGRVREALSELHPRHVAPAAAGAEDFLAGTSGVVSGHRGRLRRLADRRLDRRTAARRRVLRDRARGEGSARRVLAIGVESPDVENTMAATHAELARSRHVVEVRTRMSSGAGKFENLNELLAEAVLDRVDWLVVVDDDVDLPPSFLDVFLMCCEAGDLKLAQPAQRLSSHAAWDITRRRDHKADWRETTFVEIGPVTAFHRDTFGVILPFPDVRMGWGLDAHWSALAQANGWRIGIVDAVPIGHSLRAVAATYPREEALAEARTFLAGRPYVKRADVRTLRTRRLDDEQDATPPAPEAGA
jgi:GT2 family glycosyltransferase